MNEFDETDISLQLQVTYILLVTWIKEYSKLHRQYNINKGGGGGKWQAY
jgi:hypothetical protein